MSKKSKKLVIIDGNALIHRSFHAIPPTLRTKDGLLVNAVYGFSSFLLKALTEIKPDHVILTLDKKGPTFRHEVYSDYKATRIKAPDELYEQIPVVKRVAEAFNIPIFEMSGFEADDLIGTICNIPETKELEKIIITGDMDTLQLVNEKTKVYTMSRGLSDSVLYDEEKIREKYGFGAQTIVDYKALRGDPSDNIPGVKGVGEKSATELLLTFKNLDNLYQAVEQKDKRIKDRIINLLKEDRNKAYLSKELATINRNVPIKFNQQLFDFYNFDSKKVFELFSELEFKSLLAKVKNLKDASKYEPEGSTKIKEAEKINYQIIETKQDIENLIKKIKIDKKIVIRSIVNKFSSLNELAVLGLVLKNGEIFFIKNSDLKKIQAILESEEIKKVGHDLKNDYLNLKQENISLAGLDFDIMLAAYLLSPNSRNHSLNSLAFSELGLDEILSDNKNNSSQMSLNFDGLDIQSLAKESSYECELCFKLEKILRKKITNESLNKVLNEIEMPLIKILADMEHRGILFDKKPINKLSKELDLKIKNLENKIHKLAGQDFNINSPKQLKEILFEKLKIDSTGIKKTKTGLSTADDELQKMLTSHPIIPLIRDYREANKLMTTYVSPLPNIVNPKTKRIHSHFNQAITATGRLSSTEPNLQNIPARTKEGKIIRQSFITEKDWTMIGLDYSQIELRLAAHISGDKKMIQAFLAKADIHQATAAEINGVKLEDVSKKMRQEAKATNFGILYGQGPHGLAQAAGIPYYKAKECINKYFTSYPNVKKMMDQSIKEAKKNGYTITISGRKRPLPEIFSSIPMIQKSAERMAINAPIQGGAADIIKMAMIDIYNFIKNDTENIHLLLQVHDELIFEVKNTKVDYYLKTIKELMENVIKLKVPLEVEGGSAKNWGELK